MSNRETNIRKQKFGSSGLTSWMISRLIWTLMEKFKGNHVREYLAEMRQFQFQPAEDIESTKKEKLEKLLLHCVQHVPAYQAYAAELENSMQGPSWDPADFLKKLPILTKSEFNDRSADYLSSVVDKAGLISNQTGGSTGDPTRFYLDRFTVEHYEASRWRGLGWHDIHIGDPSVMIWGSSIEINQLKRRMFVWKERFLKNRIILSAYDLDEGQLDRYLNQIRRYKPKYLYGYASALFLLAEMIIRSGRTADVPLQAVVSTSETLHPHQREALKQAFDCPVVNEYGARDGGIIGFECSGGQLHIPVDNCHLEVVDLSSRLPLPNGQRGLLLVTDLNNFSMPRLRYELGDVASLSDQRCSCGVNLPILDRVEGRETDVFVTTGGCFVYGAFFNRLMLKLNSFRGFQMIQHAPNRMTVKLIKHPTNYQPHDEFKFIESIHTALGADLQIYVEHVDEIPRSASGKLRYAVREFELYRKTGG
jgi:phenylacetate-CoA ligase